MVHSHPEADDIQMCFPNILNFGLQLTVTEFMSFKFFFLGIFLKQDLVKPTECLLTTPSHKSNKSHLKCQTMFLNCKLNWESEGFYN